MNLSTVSEALEWVKDSMDNDDPRLALRVLNNIRKRLYNIYNEVNVVPMAVECLDLFEFCEVCAGRCQCSCKKIGFTLPQHIENIEAIKINGERFDFSTEMSDWAKYKNKSDIYPLPTHFSTERDIAPCGECSDVVFHVSDAADIGKAVFVRYRDQIGTKFRDKVLLTEGGAMTQFPVTMFERDGGVSFPQPTIGVVTLMQPDGTVLAEFVPSTGVARFRRYVIKRGACGGDKAYVMGSRRYFPVSCLDDIIETDNEDAIREFAKAIKTSKKEPLTDMDRSAILFHERQGKKFLVGQKSRSIGNRTRTSISTVPVSIIGVGRNMRFW